MSNNTQSTSDGESERDERLESVIAEYIRASEAGNAPSRRNLLEQYPELAVELNQFLKQRDNLNRMADPIREFGDDLFQAIGPGQQLSYVGNYELLEEIARGGMGIVYKARQKTLGRIVAVKMIVAGRWASEQDVQRFRSEAQAAASLQHPNIVSIHEVGQHEGWHYFSMDYVEGNDLSTILRLNLLSDKIAAEYVLQMAEAIHYAHQQGILHRDLKPSNILIDSHDQVRITDFGLAMRVGGDQGLTQTGQILGTPSYMPPEQAQSKRALIGPASDVYALGAILYECLTGRPPFRAETVIKTIDQVIHTEAALPRTLNAAIPRDLETICMMCLEKEPHRRYGTAQLLADDLGSFLRDEPITARPVGTIERTWRGCRRNPAIASLMATVALCLIVGTTISSYFAFKASIRAQAEAFHRRRADDKADLAQRRSHQLTEAMDKLAIEETKVRAALIAEKVASSDLEKTNHSLQNTIDREQEANYYINVLLAWREWQAGHIEAAEKHLQTCRTDLRSWEWHYIARLCRPTDSLATLEHVQGAGDVLDGMEPPGVRLSGNGRRIAYAKTDRTVLVLDTSTAKEVLRVADIEYDVSSVAISHDGGRLAALGNGRLTVWDTSTMQAHMQKIRPPAPKNNHPAYNRLEFSPDASRLIASEQSFKAVSREDSLRRWSVHSVNVLDVESGVSLDSQGWGTSVPGNCTYSSDGGRIATFHGTKCAVTSHEEGKTVEVKGEEKTIAGSVFNSDGSRLAIFDIESNIFVSNAVTGERICGWNLQPDRIERIRFSPDGSKIATLSFLSNLKVWDAANGQLIASFRESEVERPSVVTTPSMAGMAPYSNHRFFAFSPDSTRLASASGNHKLNVWDITSGNATALRTRDPLCFAVFNAGAEHQLVYTTYTNPQLPIAKPPREVTLQLNHWSSLRQDESRVLYRPGAFYQTVCVNHSGTRIASISKPARQGLNTINIWDMQSGHEVSSVPWEAGKEVYGVAFSPDDSELAMAGDSGIGVVDLTTKEIHRVPAKEVVRSHLVTFFQDGKRILVGHGGGATIHTLQTGETLVKFKGGWVMGLNADETRVATGGQDGVVFIWNAATGEKILDLSLKDPSSETHVYCVAFSPDSSRLAAADAIGRVHVWDTLSGMPLLELPAHKGRCYTVAFSPDGKRLISMGDDGFLRVWDSKNGREIMTLTGHADRVYSAAFTRDGSQIVSTSADGTIRIWDGRPTAEKN